jgi:glutathione S-transferase
VKEMDTPPMTPLLVTISFSHYCEKARWALDHAGIAYRESAHLPAFHIPAVRRAGGRRATPTLVTDEGVLSDSSDVLAWADRRRPLAGLYGKSAAERAEILRLEDLFDEYLGPHARRWAYFYLLQDRASMLRLLDAQPVAKLEHLAMRFAFPAVRALIRRGLHVHADGAERSRKKVDEVFADVSRLLEDGRPYLVGGAPTAADITFASLSLPGLIPESATVRLPPISALPAVAAAQVEAWRATPAGRFGTRIVGERARSTRVPDP